jgi:hypothetical protein
MPCIPTGSAAQACAVCHVGLLCVAYMICNTSDSWLPCACPQDPALKRHLLRLWLAPPDGRPLLPHNAEGWHSVTPGSRGGVVVAGAQDCIPLVAERGN